MHLKEQLARVGAEFQVSGTPDTIWARIPSIIPLLRDEFAKRLGLHPEFSGISLVLDVIAPTLAVGTNSVIFDTYFPRHPGMRIRCECCLEHPNAKVSLHKTPQVVDGRASDAIRMINEQCHPGTFEAQLLQMEILREETG
jgi:hypothetical protein